MIVASPSPLTPQHLIPKTEGTPASNQTVAQWRCAVPRPSTILRAGSWCGFWYDRFFYSMIFGKVMSKNRHVVGHRMVAIFRSCAMWLFFRVCSQAIYPHKQFIPPVACSTGGQGNRLGCVVQVVDQAGNPGCVSGNGALAWMRV
jgi:hypothetical protein